MVHGQGLTEQEDRWREIADELAVTLALVAARDLRPEDATALTKAALCHYEEARDA